MKQIILPVTVYLNIRLPLALLPLDRELETALFYRLDVKRCTVCGALVSASGASSTC